MGYETCCLICDAPTSIAKSKVRIFVDQLKNLVSKSQCSYIKNHWIIDNIFFQLLEEKIIDQEEYNHLSEEIVNLVETISGSTKIELEVD